MFDPESIGFVVIGIFIVFFVRDFILSLEEILAIKTQNEKEAERKKRINELYGKDSGID